MKPHCRNHHQLTAFVTRIVDDWNGLPEGIVRATTVDIFKNLLDAYWTDFFISCNDTDTTGYCLNNDSESCGQVTMHV